MSRSLNETENTKNSGRRLFIVSFVMSAVVLIPSLLFLQGHLTDDKKPPSDNRKTDSVQPKNKTNVSQNSVATMTERLAKQESITEANKLTQNGHYKQAIKVVETLIHDWPNDMDLLAKLGSLQWLSGDKKGAESSFLTITKSNPEHGPAHYGLGLIYKEKIPYQFGPAIREFRAAIQGKPLVVDSFYELGMLYVKTRRFDNALKQFKQLLEEDPGYILAHHGIGLVWMRQKNMAEPSEPFDKL